jgi:hypothetical protein
VHTKKLRNTILACIIAVACLPMSVSASLMMWKFETVEDFKWGRKKFGLRPTLPNCYSVIKFPKEDGDTNEQYSINWRCADSNLVICFNNLDGGVSCLHGRIYTENFWYETRVFVLRGLAQTFHIYTRD